MGTWSGLVHDFWQIDNLLRVFAMIGLCHDTRTGPTTQRGSKAQLNAVRRELLTTLFLHFGVRDKVDS
jgi:hypothetical protein